MINNIRFGVFCAAMAVACYSHKANAQGTIYTVAGDCYKIAGDKANAAGNGIAGFAAERNEAINKVFSTPCGVATDGAGNIYIADYTNHRVRVVSPAGTTSTVEGAGVYGYTGMNGLVIAPGGNNQSLDSKSPDFFAQCAYGANAATNKEARNTGNIPQNDPGKISDMYPRGMWRDNSGNLFVADGINNRICKADAGTNTVHTVTGGGARGFSPDGTPAASCLWGSISGVCTDKYGNIFVSDRANRVVRMIDAKGYVRTIAGTGASGYSGDGGPALNATFRSPGCMFINSAGDLFICDHISSVVRVMNVYDESVNIETLAGTGESGFSGDGELANTAKLNNPTAVWQDAEGVIYIADMGNMRVRSVVRSKFAKEAVAAFSIFPNPSSGTFTVVTNTMDANSSIEVFNIIGEKVHSETVSQSQTTIKLNQPAGVYDVVLRSGGVSKSQKIVIGK